MPKRRYTKPDPIVPDVVPPVYEEVREPDTGKALPRYLATRYSKAENVL